jgi:membrane protease YdiL (CAAX protease family)
MNHPTLSSAPTKTETLWGIAWLAASTLMMPILLTLLNILLPQPMSAAMLNVVYYCINFAVILIIFRPFLRESALLALQRIPAVLGYGVLGYLGYYVLTTLLTQGILLIEPDFGNINDESIFSMLDENTIPLALATVFLVPVAEETLYRGLFFRKLLDKNILTAYIVSMVTFASIHVMGYVGVHPPLTLLLCFLQYLPAGFCLCFCYRQTGTIMTPILVHTIVNAVGICTYLR